MARGRMLDQAFARSQKLNSVSRDARLAYATILPFLDREGRAVAEPIVLKANCFRWSDYTLDEIAHAVQELASAGLIRLYADADNAAILEYADFLKHNTPNKREAKSTLPGPDDQGTTDVRDRTLRNAVGDVAEVVARALHVQRTGDASTLQVENVNGTERLTINGTEHTRPPTALEPSPQPLAAAPPRESHDPHQFVEAWNANRGRLPAVTALNNRRRGAIRALVKEHGAPGALALFRDATLAVAHDEFWIARQYGFDNLLTAGKALARAEQWRAGAKQLGEGNIRLAANVERWSRALPPDPEPGPETAVN